jgi:hypothetical protein
MMMERVQGGNGDAIPPTLLFCDAASKVSLHHIREAFQENTGESSLTTTLEGVNRRWDFFRRQHGMPVVPPGLYLMGSPDRTTTAHSFMFDPKVAPVTEEIMSDKGTIVPTFTAIDNSSYYTPASGTHSPFESMHVAESGDGETHSLVLFQSNINTDVPNAVAGLNQAAMALGKKIWKEKFLFVIFALDHEGGCPATVSSCEHPIIFVTKENLAEYFTPTVAPAALLHYVRHQRLNTTTTADVARK